MTSKWILFVQYYIMYSLVRVHHDLCIPTMLQNMHRRNSYRSVFKLRNIIILRLASFCVARIVTLLQYSFCYIAYNYCVVLIFFGAIMQFILRSICVMQYDVLGELCNFIKRLLSHKQSKSCLFKSFVMFSDTFS